MDSPNRSVNWHAVEIEIHPGAREAVEYALMEAEALGTELSAESAEGATITGYFAAAPDAEAINQAISDALRIYSLTAASVRSIQFRTVEDRDWLEEWKRSWKPVRTGRFIVAPPWSEIEAAPGDLLIRIEPGMAFGTGTHETTRLCLAMIEKHCKGGSVLDVGTGTGVLAIAAAGMFPLARIAACDTDAEAVAIARENAAINGVADSIEFSVGSVLAETGQADFVCANLSADTILKLLPGLLCVKAGTLVLSGILDSQAEAVVSALVEHGVLEVKDFVRDGEWVAIVV